MKQRTFCSKIALLLPALFPYVALAADTVVGSKSPGGPSVLIPLQPQPAFFSPAAGLVQFRCKDFKLTARSRISPSITYPISEGPFNEKDCKSSQKSLQEKGCFCDEDELKCLETKKIEPLGIACPSPFLCFELRGEKKGLFKIVSLGRFVTRKACEAELQDLERSLTE